MPYGTGASYAEGIANPGGTTSGPLGALKELPPSRRIYASESGGVAQAVLGASGPGTTRVIDRVTIETVGSTSTPTADYLDGDTLIEHIDDAYHYTGPSGSAYRLGGNGDFVVNVSNLSAGAKVIVRIQDAVYYASGA